MKHGESDTIEHQKLRMRLDLPRYATTGVIEELRMLAISTAPGGDIGRYSNEELAIHLGWAGDPDALFDALVECDVLDEHPTHRLIMRGWADIIPDFLHRRLAKAGQLFADGTKPKTSRLTVGQREAAEAKYKAGRPPDTPGTPQGCPKDAPGTANTIEHNNIEHNHNQQSHQEESEKGKPPPPCPDGDGASRDSSDGDANRFVTVAGIQIPREGIPDTTPSGKRAAFDHDMTAVNRKHRKAGTTATEQHKREFSETICRHLGGTVEGDASSLGRVISCERDYGGVAVQRAAGELISEPVAFPDNFKFPETRCKKHKAANGTAATAAPLAATTEPQR